MKGKVLIISALLTLFLFSSAFAQPGPKVYIVQSEDCSFLTYYGTLCHDTDDGKLYKWNGATQEEVGGSGDITSVWNDSAGDVSALVAAAGDSLNAAAADSSAPFKSGNTAGKPAEPCTSTHTYLDTQLDILYICLATVWTSYNPPTNAETVTIAAEAADTTMFPLLATALSGNNNIKGHTGLTFNALTGLLTIPSFSTGAGGFTVDADGDVTAVRSITVTAGGSITIAKSSGVAGQSCVNTSYTTDAFGICVEGPDDTRSANLLLKYPDGSPASSILVYPTPTTNRSTAAWRKLGTWTDARWCSYSTAGGLACTETAPGGAFTGGTLTSNLTLATGTTGAGTSPLKFVSGTSMTTPEAGAMEFTTDALYFTISTGAARKTVAFTDGSNLSLASSVLATAITDEVGTGYLVFNTAPTFVTSIAPTTAGTATLGTTALEWGNVYLTDSAVIYGQADQSNSMTSSASGWTFNQPITLGPQTTTAASIYFQEGSGGGTNKVRLQGPTSTADVTITLPALGGTVALIDQAQSWTGVQTMTSAALTTPVVTTDIHAVSSGGATLGNATYPFGDTYLKDGVALYVAAENLTLTVGSTTQLNLSSGTGITDLSFTGLNLVTTGTISGAIPRLGTWASPITSTGAYSLAASNSYGMWIYYNDTDEITLPAAVGGMSVCVQVPAATLVPVGPNGTDVIVLEGTPLSAGQAFSIAAVAGNFACLIADVANHWVTAGTKGTMTAIP